ncbi:MAG: YtxH domain-containing protein [bacterium]
MKIVLSKAAKRLLRTALFVIAGATLGALYYYTVGCQNGGACLITSKWYVTAAYGGLVGLTASFI